MTTLAEKHVIAIDLGAESGRVLNVGFNGERLHADDVHRFPNIPVRTAGKLYWDVLRLWHEISTGVNMALSGASSMGIDTWGVDFALLDRDGQLLSNPVHYRDDRTIGIFDWAFERMPRREIFERTGIQFMEINGLYQIASMVRDNSPLLDRAATFLTIADLFNYWLSGARSCEFTHVTTQQAYNPRLKNWDFELLGALGIPTQIFPEIVAPGTQIGAYSGVPVIVPACHDTGSAVVAVPTTTKNYAYISSGTWSLIGVEVDEAVINDGSYEANLTNEGGLDGTYRLLKNVMGLWIAQQCRAAWREQGHEYSYDELTAQASAAEPFRSFIEPDDPTFLRPGDMPERIREFCARTGQPQPETVGQVMRTVYESLALKYRYVLEKLIALSGNPVERMHVIGGGSKNALLCQMTADAIGRMVVAGPVEATALGNAVVQFIALGEIGSVSQAREILSRTTGTVTYEPTKVSAWDDAYGRFKALLS